MARKLAVDLDAEIMTRQGAMTVEEALGFFADEDGNVDVAQAIVYAALRKMALAKDNARHAAHVPAPRVYAPRVDGPESRLVDAFKATLREFRGEAPSTPARVRPAPVDADERLAQVARATGGMAGKTRKPATPAQLAARAKFAAAAKARHTAKAAGKPASVDAQIAANEARIRELEAAIAAKAAPAKAAPPVRVRKAAPVALPPAAPPAPPVDVTVVRKATDTSDDAILAWACEQPDPAKIRVPDIIRAFPGVSVNRAVALKAALAA